MAKVMSKKEDVFYDMMNEANIGYKAFGNWDWTLSSCWRQDETKNLIQEVKKLIEGRIRTLDIDKRIGIRTEAEIAEKLAIYNQMLKFTRARLVHYRDLFKNL